MYPRAPFQRSLLSRLWYESMRFLFQMVGVVGYKVHYSGQHNIPPEGGVLVVSNHQSHFDPPLVGMGCRRRMNYLARQSLFGFAPFRWICRSLDAIPIDLEGIGLSGFKESLRRLKRGGMLLMFPEGTRTDDGEVGKFMPGFTALAARSKAAILPVAIEGAFAAWPKGRKFPRLGTIHVHYGPPILPGQIEDYDAGELVAEVHRRVCDCQARLRRHPVLAGHWRDFRAD